MHRFWSHVVVLFLWPIWWPLAVVLLVRSIGTEHGVKTEAGRLWRFCVALARVSLGAQ